MTTKTLRAAALAITISFGLASLTALPARADNTWITGPVLSRVSLQTQGAKLIGTTTLLSTQTNSFVLAYRGPSGDAGKFVQVNFFDFTPGVTLALTSSPTASATGCDQQVLGGNSHSCMFKLDGSGSANIAATVGSVSEASSFKYLLLSGPNIAQTDPATVSFVVPKATIKPVVASVKALISGAALVRFRLQDGASAVSGVRANVSFKGIATHVSAGSVTSDAEGYLWVYVANLSKKRGTTTINATIEGTSTKASATVKWVAGKLGN